MDLDKIQYVPSPNKSRRLSKITHLIVHAMAGSMAGSIAHFSKASSKVSAHYLISKKGEVLCMVKPEARAWHVRNFNDRSIGIELEDYDRTTKKNCLTDPHWLTEPELKALVFLSAALLKTYKIPLENVWGHNNPALRKLGNTHSDPGPHFPWDKFRLLLKKELEADGETSPTP